MGGNAMRITSVNMSNSGDRENTVVTGEALRCPD